jgi:hypothetical protein
MTLNEIKPQSRSLPTWSRRFTRLVRRVRRHAFHAKIERDAESGKLDALTEAAGCRLQAKLARELREI